MKFKKGDDKGKMDIFFFDCDGVFLMKFLVFFFVEVDLFSEFEFFDLVKI